MLKRLSITNFVLIESLSIEWNDGLSIITGETGAGKSILLGALQLVLGERADLKALKNNEEKCVIEAIFDVSDASFKPFFDANDLDYFPETIFRREISPQGRSRAFVNDVPVQLTVLQDLSNQLIDVHSQFSSSQILSPSYQLQLLDAVAKNERLLEKYQGLYAQLKYAQETLTQKQERLQKLTEQSDYQTFLFDELMKAQLKPDEQATLESELETLENSEEIITDLGAIQQLSENEMGILGQLNEVQQRLKKNAPHAHFLNELLERFLSAKLELEDVLNELSDHAESFEFNPSRQQEVQERLDLIYSLQRKHQVNSISELLVIQENLDEEQQDFSRLESEISQLQKQITDLSQQAQELAYQLSERRAEKIQPIADNIHQTLQLLEMPNARIELQQEKLEHLGPNGIDKVAFYFSANKGIPPSPIEKAASGGEQSRLMLAIKKLISEHLNLPTLILDEIDTGVSGKVADAMGQVMQEMSAHAQIVAITHLPQVASKGKTHFKVQKSDTQDRTTTAVIPLNPEQRIQEIAQMLSGENITQTALEQARFLLG